MAIEARNAAAAGDSAPDAAGAPPGPDAAGGTDQEPGTVITLRGRRTPIPEDRRPLPSVDVYDQLLTHRTRKGAS